MHSLCAFLLYHTCLGEKSHCYPLQNWLLHFLGMCQLKVYHKYQKNVSLLRMSALQILKVRDYLNLYADNAVIINYRGF